MHESHEISAGACLQQAFSPREVSSKTPRRNSLAEKESNAKTSGRRGPASLLSYTFNSKSSDESLPPHPRFAIVPFPLQREPKPALLFHARTNTVNARLLPFDVHPRCCLLIRRSNAVLVKSLEEPTSLLFHPSHRAASSLTV